jgi:ribosomal protein L1
VETAVVMPAGLGKNMKTAVTPAGNGKKKFKKKVHSPLDPDDLSS